MQVNQGTVVAVGPGRRSTAGELIPVAVKEGDKVLLPDYGGLQVKLDDKEYVLLCSHSLHAYIADRLNGGTLYSVFYSLPFKD